MAYDIDISTYINSDTSVTTEKLQDVASRIRSLLIQNWSNLDFNPGSVFGSLFVAPASKAIALFEDAASCILTDVDLTNALNGIVCDCDFLESYLTGLGITTLTDANVTGMIRLKFILDDFSTLSDEISFSDDKGRYVTFDTGEVIMFKDTYIFNLYSPASNTPIKIYEPNTTGLDRANNEYTLSYSSIDLNDNIECFVDLPVYGPSTAEVTADTLGKIDESTSELLNTVLSEVTMVDDVTPYTTPSTVAELLTLTRTIQPSANFSSKNNIVSYIYQKFPTTVGCSVITNQDDECKRQYYSTNLSSILTSKPIVDLYTKGCTTYTTVTEYIPWDYSLVDTPQTYVLQHIPLYVSDISKTFYYDGSTTTVSESDPNALLMFNDYDNADKILTQKTIYNYNTLPTTITDSSNVTDCNYITITYLCDPIQEAISTFIMSEDCNPILDVKSTNFFPVIIENLTIKYNKSVNTFFDRQAVIDDIYTIVNSLTYPNNNLDLYISNLLLNNNVSAIKSITHSANVYIQFAKGEKRTALSYMIDGSTDDQLSSLQDFGVGDKTISYVLDRNNIKLIETSSVQ